MLTKTYKFILFSSILISILASTWGETRRQNVRKFPDGFQFGTATASYQVEGAWNEDGEYDEVRITLLSLFFF